MSAPATAILVVLLVVVLTAPQRWALMGLMGGILYLTQGQSIDLFGLNIYPMRLLGLAGFCRVVARGEFSSSQITAMDRALLWAYGYVTVVYLIRTGFGQGTSSAIGQTSTLSKIGLLVDVILGYFAFRGLIPNSNELTWFLRHFTLFLLPYVVLLMIERATGSNPLAIVGASPNIWIDIGRTRARCMGSFMHPSLLGTFGASFFLLYVSLALREHGRINAAIGILLCLIIVFLSNSGGPLSFLVVGVGSWFLWTVREKMSAVRRMIVGLVAVLAMVMKDPVWYLPSKMSNIFGGSGWHRSYLMHQGFSNIDKWWLAGMPMDLTRDWFPYLLLGAADMTNLYLVFGVDGGIVALLLFVRLLVMAFKELGRALTAARNTSPPSREFELLLWGLGVVLAGHMINFQAITYFDQTNMVWLMQLAAIASLCKAGVLKEEQEEVQRPKTLRGVRSGQLAEHRRGGGIRVAVGRGNLRR